jgi:uncharacterized protein (TIGR00255 family)
MTGFGKAARDFRGDAVSIELSAVNHRFFDAAVRLPLEWSPLDTALREVLRERVTRGKVNVSVSRRRANGVSNQLRLDKGLAERYIRLTRELASLLGSNESVSVQTIAQFPEIFTAEGEDEDLDAVREFLVGLLGEALGGLETMRENEGRALTKDLRARLDSIRSSLATVEDRLPLLTELYTERLRTRVQELAQDVAFVEDRLALEVALAAERGDVSEEIVRLKSHLDHAMDLIGGGEPAGRKLNFLSQEMQREINTLGSKVRDTEVVRQVLEMKSELERFREQIQNIE